MAEMWHFLSEKGRNLIESEGMAKKRGDLSFELKFPEKDKKIGTPDEIRTHDLLLRRQTLYPAELRVQPCNVP